MTHRREWDSVAPLSDEKEPMEHGNVLDKVLDTKTGPQSWLTGVRKAQKRDRKEMRRDREEKKRREMDGKKKGREREREKRGREKKIRD